MHRRICFGLGSRRQSRGQLAAVWGRKEHCESGNGSEDRGRGGGIDDSEQARRRKTWAMEEEVRSKIRKKTSCCSRKGRGRGCAEGMIRSAEDEVC